MNKTFPVLALFFFLLPAPSMAEINVGNSLEWLCASSDLVVKGRIISVVKYKESESISGFTFRIDEFLKGSGEKDVFCSVKWFSAERLETYKKNKTELLVFLKKPDSLNVTNEKSLQYNVPESYNSVPALVDLENPGTTLISATGYKVINNPSEILLRCSTVINEINVYLSNGVNIVKGYYLEIEYNTDAWDILYAGSACYLIVPHFMYLGSREKFF